MTSAPFIDCHHHLWNLEQIRYPWLMAKGERRFFGDPTPIQRNYLVNEFLNESAQFRPLASVHIQVGAADGEALNETRWLQQHSQHPQAIVAFADLSANDIEAQISAHLQSTKVRGFRQIVGRHTQEDGKHGTSGLLTSRAWLDGLRLLAQHELSFDLQMIPPQMPAVINALQQVPELKVALCHCGSPWDQSPAGIERWKQGLMQLAELPNVSCKVSGLGMFNPTWSVEELRPIILTAIEVFGPDRVMFGSNFPVDKLYRSYEELWHTYSVITAAFSEQERERLFLRNAADFYSIAI